MKSSKQVIPLFIFGAVIYFMFFQDDNSGSSASGPVSVDGSNVEQHSSKLSSYAERGVANSWPAIEAGFADLDEDITAKNYYLAVDASGSMGDSDCSDGRSKLSVAKESIRLFIEKLPADAGLGIHAFDERGIGERVPIGKNNVDVAISIVNALKPAGGTPLSMSVEAGYKALTQQAKKQRGYGEYNLVIITDGEANAGYEPTAAIEKLLAESAITIHTVGFCINENHSLNQPGFTIYKAANNPAALTAGLEDVLSEAPDFDVIDFQDN